MTDEVDEAVVDAIVTLYSREIVTIDDAARLADVDRSTMRDIFRDRDVELRLGLPDKDDREYEAKQANEEILQEREHKNKNPN